MLQGSDVPTSVRAAILGKGDDMATDVDVVTQASKPQGYTGSSPPFTDEPGRESPLLSTTTARSGPHAKLHLHLGQRMKPVDVSPADMRWHHVGGGVHCRIFLNADKLITTTATGPPVVDIVRRVIRDISTGKVIDMCNPDLVPDRIPHRSLGRKTHFMVEVTTKDAEKWYNEKGPDVVEIF